MRLEVPYVSAQMGLGAGPRRACLLLSLLFLCSARVSAEGKLILPTEGQRQAARIASWGTVIAANALDTYDCFKADDRGHCFKMQGLRTGVSQLAAYGTKKLFHRARPCAPANCGLDDPYSSFYSGHAANAWMAFTPKRAAVVIPLGLSTDFLRELGDRHYWTDVAVGSLVGLATSRIR